jgi:hypothetical protein
MQLKMYGPAMKMKCFQRIEWIVRKIFILKNETFLAANEFIPH